MTKQIKYLLMILTLIYSLMFIFNTKVYAATLLKEPIENVWIFRKGGDVPSFSAQFQYYSFNGKSAYCIEPGAHITAEEYEENEGLINSPFTDEINEKLELIGYYGYDYPGHQTLNYRMATQALIWETVGSQTVEYWTKPSGAGTYLKVNTEKNNILKLINKHYIKPSFDSDTVGVLLNQEITLIDNNEVLNEFEIANSDIDAKIVNNNLIINPTEIGNYKIKLKKKTYTNNPTTIFIDKDMASQKMAHFGLSTSIYATINVNVLAGKIRLTKLDNDTKKLEAQGSATLKGAVYGIYDKDNKKISSITIGDDLTGISDYLPYGEYIIKEEVASDGYKIDDSTYKVYLDSFETVNISVYEEVIKGRIKILKYDEKHNACINSGDAELYGATYQIYNSKNDLVDEVSINEECFAITKYLPYDTYTVKEKNNSIGYLLDKNTYKVNIRDENIYEIVSKEKVIEKEIEIYKVLANNNTSILTYEDGAVFDFYLKSTMELYESIITDQNGFAKVTLPYGTYIVRQTKAKDNHEMIEDFEINVLNNVKETKIIANDYLKAKIKIIKVDAETGKNITDNKFKFKIKNLDTLEYVCQNITYPFVDNICTFETTNGIFTTPNYLQFGNYQIEEIESDYGSYLWNKEPLKFSINSNSDFKYENNETIIELKFPNKRVKGEILIEKYGEELVLENNTYYYKEIRLDNVSYSMYANEDIINNGDTIYKKGDLVTSFYTTNGSYKLKDLYLGKYYLVETSTYSNHTLNNEPYYFEVKYTDKTTEIVNVYIKQKNYLKKGNFELSKIDLTTGNSIPNVKFEIYTNDFIKIYEGVTNDGGKINVEDLPIGKYIFREISTPEGYISDYAPHYFEINNDKQTVSIEITNQKIDVPNTGKNELNTVLISLILIVGGIIINEKRKI